MGKSVTYTNNQKKTNVVEESSTSFVRTFSSQEEAEQYRLQQNLAMSDMEKFHKFCRLMRIGRMLSSGNVSSHK